MKSLIIIISLIISTECHGSYSKDDNTDSSHHQKKVAKVKPTSSPQRKGKVSVPAVTSQRSLNSRTSSNDENGTIESPAITSETVKDLKSPKKKVVANRENATKMATPKSKIMRKNVPSLEQKADMEPENTSMNEKNTSANEANGTIESPAISNEIEKDGVKSPQNVGKPKKKPVARGNATKKATSKSEMTKKSEPTVDESADLQPDNTSNKENGATQSAAITNDETDQMKPSLSIEEMMKVAMTNRDNAIKNATSKFEETKKNVQALEEKAEMERETTLKKINEQCQKAESKAGSIMTTATTGLAEARMKAEKEYNQMVTSVDEELREAVEEYKAAFKAAGDEFVKIRDQLEEDRRNLENQHQDVLEKARKEREAAVQLAKQKMETANQNDGTGKVRKMKSKSTGNTESANQNEMDFQKAVELADNEWLKVLDSIGLGREFEEALEKAVKGLENAREEAKLNFEGAIEEYEKDLEAAKVKRQETNRLAKDGSMKLQDEYMKIMEIADNHKIDMSKNAWNKWKEMEIQANEELHKAHIEFINDKKMAMDEWRNAMKVIDEMKRKETQEAKTEIKTPKKTVQRTVPKNRGLKKPPNRGAGKKDPGM